MDKKAKKKIDVLNKKMQMLKQQLSGAKQQDDEPGEVKRLETEITSCQEQVAKLKAGA